MMTVLYQILNNHLFINAAASWIIAQILKAVIYACVNRTFDIKRLFGDGGMPSGHSATVTALATTAALECGFDSPEFAVSAIFAVVVMHDAMGIRLEAGKHAKMLNELFVVVNGEIDPEQSLKEFLGHTPSQVVCGAVLGFIIAVLRG